MMIDVQWDHVRLVLWEVWDRQWLQQTNKHLIKWRGIKNVTVSFRVASVHLAVSVAIDPPRLPPFSVTKVQASESVFLSEYKKHGKENTRHVRSSDCGLSLEHKGFWDPGPCQTDYVSSSVPVVRLLPNGGMEKEHNMMNDIIQRARKETLHLFCFHLYIFLPFFTSSSIIFSNKNK